MQRVSRLCFRLLVGMFLEQTYRPFVSFLIFQITWMKREGGLNPKEHVRRVMAKIFVPDLIPQMNRTGGYGKMKFHQSRENDLKVS